MKIGIGDIAELAQQQPAATFDIKADLPIKIQSNLHQVVVVTTEDKLHRCLSAHLKMVERKQGWIAPAGVLLTIVTTYVTATFRDFVFKAPVWQAIFIISGVLCAGWLIVTLKDIRKSSTVEEVIDNIKTGAQS